MSKTKLFIDFDGTVFNTKAFKQKIFAAISNLGFSEEEVLSVYQKECLDKHFSLDGMIARLRKLKSFDLEKEVKHVNNIYSDTSKLIFADFLNFIEQIDRKKYEVNLLTLGDLKFQKRKVESSGIIEYFDHLYYTTEEKSSYLKKITDKNEKFFIVDDRADTIEKVSETFPNAVALWIDRGSRDFDDPTLISKKCEKEVKKFGDVIMYL